MYSKRKFSICSTFDTETTNLIHRNSNGSLTDAHAFPILYIDNDLRGVDLLNYESPRDDDVSLYRYETEYLEKIDEYIKWGIDNKTVPIVCAYNLMFDLYGLIYELNKKYSIRVNAASSMNVYTLDLYDFDEENLMLLRFWDTFHLEMGGLAAMGKTCGLPKFIGGWDYTKIRTPETPLTPDEIYYAKRDVQVIPAYLKYILHANSWANQGMLGNKILTKTSIVRRMARHEIAQLKIEKDEGKTLTVDKAFLNMCKKELADTYPQYCLRKACFTGGFTFTAARTCCKVVDNVYSLDVTSMHHTYINGRYIPTDFRIATEYELNIAFKEIVNTSLDYVLENYHKPFNVAGHFRIRFRNMRLKKNSCFEYFGISLIPESKFSKELIDKDDVGGRPTLALAENDIKDKGWHFDYKNGVFALGKLYSAEVLIANVSEIELWCLAQVYDWDSYDVILGEVSNSFCRPPDYITLQSNMLFEMKSAAKRVVNTYKENEKYEGSLNGVPKGIADKIKTNEITEQFLNSWYVSTVKGMFNGIYGTQAQDIFKPAYKCEDGVLSVDDDTRLDDYTYNPNDKKAVRVNYTYGMRIVGGSRMHLVIAMMLLWNRFNTKVLVTGGDTDSLKISVDKTVSENEIVKTLEPLGEACTVAIDMCMERIRKNFPKLASNLKNVGWFDVENTGKPYEKHIELWNKSRISFDGEKFHVTMAGVPRPENTQTVETFLNTAYKNGTNVYECLTDILGYNCWIDNSLCHVLGRHTPEVTTIYNGEVTDYLGNTTNVTVHEVICLYNSSRQIGGLDKTTNLDTLRYIEKHYGTLVNIDERILGYDDNGYYIHELFGGKKYYGK